MTTKNEPEVMESKNNDISFSTEEQFRYKRVKEKKLTDVFEIAFCGHFSAGKSTILNKLLQAEVLPTSPIPTSANLIHIRQGELSLTVHNYQQDDIVFHGDIPWDKVRRWGMNGNESSGMTIRAPLPFLGSHGSIVDTPGVDSTDKNHETVTVEQLYTTDVIVYVMDYNHVQSETNIYFLKQLSTLQKPIFLIINQIDKHNDAEISLKDFKQSVEDLMTQWDINFIELFFTSMKKEDHEANQYSAFESQLKALLYHGDQLLDKSQKLIEKGFYQSVNVRMKEELQQEIKHVYDTIQEKGYDVTDFDQHEILENELNELKNYETVIRENYKKETTRLYDNVTLFPYTTTELARSWLESVQPGFKMGLIFSKKKTEEEQNRRANALVTELQDKINSQLLFHVREYFQKVDRKELSNQELFDTHLQSLRFQVSSDWLLQQVNSGPMSRDYLYIFTNEVTKKIVKIIQDQAATILSTQIEGFQKTVIANEEKVKEKLATLDKLTPYKNKLIEINRTFDDQFSLINEQIQQLSNDDSFVTKINETKQLSYPSNNSDIFEDIVMPDDSVIERDEEVDSRSFVQSDFSEEEVNLWMSQVKRALLERSQSSLLQNERQQLLDRIHRNEDQSYVISLFGAFSAGKSSFANALLGDDVMPVSPHPTTATVLTVQQSDESYAHGTALITIKSKQALTEEVKSIGHSLDLELDLPKLLNKWEPASQKFVSNWQKTSAKYLSVIKQSVQETTLSLGETMTISHDELHAYVAEEKTACLVEKVTLYYDCKLTKKGIILVDTPGVNSIHARHTNVAFKQLRQSDAIFYLTYYNHAFSKADHYFLQQLGKVNESFGYDKLYFVINAADLANSRRELNGVKHHVKEQLTRNGIDEPRLYTLSSRDGLAEKRAEAVDSETSFSQFEDVFYHQTILELKSLSFSILKNNLEQYTHKLNDTATFMNEDKQAQIQKQKAIKEAAENGLKYVEESSFSHTVQEVLHELDQFSLFLRQRMHFVLNDYFPSAINVSVLTGSTKKELHAQLTAAIQEWRGLGERFLKQELESVTIRLENAIKKASEKWVISEKDSINKRLPYLQVNEELSRVSMDVSIGEITFPIDAKTYLPLLNSKKDFFENQKIKQLKEKLVSDGTTEASTVIFNYEEKLREITLDRLSDIEEILKKRLRAAIHEESVRFDAILDVEEQKAVRKELTSLSEIQ
ncbi:dynamin family protein [Salipaludibacillus sp. HK11]|uniref:dynamin family protein n=1 Tax=Salipaludibacillus sp. HK11 TaxID=3394320 RepID=UPI0039FD4CA2